LAQSDPSLPGAISLDQLIALNDEIAALVRAGVPLEPALAELGADLPGRLGKIATLIAERASRGQSLPQVLADESARLPPVYRAVVEAGLRSGRLSAALEALASSIRRVGETRRGVATAALYPLLVLMLAWGLFAFFAYFTAARLASAFTAFDVAGQGLFRWLAQCGQWAAYWGPAIPLLLLVLAIVWWYRSSRAAIAEPRFAGRLLGWLPWVGRTLRWSRTATFAEVLALLVENRVPLDEAVVLAAETSGDPRMVPAARELAAALARGGKLDPHSLSRRTFPPLLMWLMVTAQQHRALLPGLKHAAETYHRRAQHQAELARVFLPVVLTLVLGGTVVLLYGLTLFVPYTTLLRALGRA
jgi:type II secretory pathway component PulF